MVILTIPEDGGTCLRNRPAVAGLRTANSPSRNGLCLDDGVSIR